MDMNGFDTNKMVPGEPPFDLRSGRERELEEEVEYLRGSLEAIWGKYQAGGAQHEPTTGLAGTLAYMARDALKTSNVQAEGAAQDLSRSSLRAPGSAADTNEAP